MRGYFGIGVEGINKPFNVGNLFRSAHAFGVSFVFTVAEEGPSVSGVDADPSEWAIPIGTVTNWESLWMRGPLIDTIVYEADGPRRLSTVPLQMIAV